MEFTLFHKGNPFVVEVDDADWQEVRLVPWVIHKNKSNTYVRSTGKPPWGKVYLHRFLMNAKPGHFVDHINGNGLCNRRNNLRFCTRYENRLNSTRGNKNGFKGVLRQENKSGTKFQARIKANKKKINLGVFETAKEAALAYDNAARELHGEFARLNFPESA